MKYGLGLLKKKFVPKGEVRWLEKIIMVVFCLLLLLTAGCSNDDMVSTPQVKVHEWGTVSDHGSYYVFAEITLKNNNQRAEVLEKVKVGSAYIREQYAIKGIPERSPEVWAKQEKLNFPLELKAGIEYHIILSSNENELFEQMDKYGMDIYFNDHKYSVGVQ